MKKEEIHFGDWMRVLIGEFPASFFIELLIRIIFIYILLVVSMRLMGKRMASQLNRNELAALVSLAAAIGVPLLSPERGLLPALIIAIVVIGVERLVSYFAFKNQQFERFTQGNVDVLVQDSVLQFNTMQHTLISKDRLYAQLRSHDIIHLGQVKRVYFEADGSFTIVKNDKPQPGLCVIPALDVEFIQQQKFSDELVCKNCGNKQDLKDAGDKKCSNCGSTHWTNAVQP